MSNDGAKTPDTKGPDRKDIIKGLEDALGCPLLCYATGDRQGQQTQIGEDAIPFFYDHLSVIGKTNRLALLLYSRGGHTLAGFAMANAMWEFGKDVKVLVPFRAHSCATLISLAASSIFMGAFGQLSPIDPSITTPHGPMLEVQGQEPKFIPVSVEDVAGFFSLAKSEAKLGDDRLSEAFGHLCQKVNPLALGAVYRAREQIGMLAKKMLKKHLKDESKIEPIIAALSRELLSHDYVIGRSEARAMGLPIEDVSDKVEGLMWALYSDIATEMKLAQGWNPEAELGGQNQVKRTNTRCVIQSAQRKHVFETTHELKRTTVTKDGNKFEAVQGKILDEGWRRA